MSRAADTRIVVGTPDRGAADLAKLLRDPVFSHHHGRDVFTDFVEIAARTVEALPAHVHTAATGTPFVEEADTDAAFARARKRYGQRGIDVFGKAFALLTLYGDAGQRSGEYVDLLGMAYEDLGYSNPGAGQFFTPTEVCRLMAGVMVEGVEAEVHERIKAALSEHPMGFALALGGLLYTEAGEAERYLLDRLIPAALATGVKPVTVMDPCCGSGRTLMAAAELIPRWALDAGLVAFYGQDIDQTCVWMCRLNHHLYGLRGGPMPVEAWQAWRELCREATAAPVDADESEPIDDGGSVPLPAMAAEAAPAPVMPPALVAAAPAAYVQLNLF